MMLKNKLIDIYIFNVSVKILTVRTVNKKIFCFTFYLQKYSCVFHLLLLHLYYIKMAVLSDHQLTTWPLTKWSCMYIALRFLFIRYGII